jgi:hypothetical protein
VPTSVGGVVQLKTECWLEPALQVERRFTHQAINTFRRNEKFGVTQSNTFHLRMAA